MSQITTHAPGTFCWVELGTTDPDAAKRFYAGVLGWEWKDTPTGDTVYTLLNLGGREVGGLYSLQKEQVTQGVPPHWLTYVAVTSADEAAKKAVSLGATSLVAPFDVMEHGRMSVLMDPAGGTFAVWQAKAHAGAGVLFEPGSLSWCELLTHDTAAAGKFYSALFGWAREDMPMQGMTYSVFSQGETKVGGMMTILKEWGETPAHWLAYFAVDNCEARVEKAKRLGAMVFKPVTEVPGIGYFAVLADPQGATFALVQNA